MYPKFKVFLSPSSQNGNGWKIYEPTPETGPYFYEEVYWNEIVDLMIPILERHNQETMRNNIKLIYSDHTAQSNAWGADYHLVPHSNGSTSHTVRGLTVMCLNPEIATKESTLLAHSVYDSLQAIMPLAGHGVKASTFDELKNTTCPAVYGECLYHDQPDDQKFLLTHKMEIAIAYVKGYFNHVKIIYDGLEEAKPMYRVQCGAFRNNVYANIYYKDVMQMFLRENILRKAMTPPKTPLVLPYIKTEME